MSIKYATNHNEHAKDVKANDRIAGASAAFEGALAIETADTGIKALLTAACEEATKSTQAYDTAAAQLLAALKAVGKPEVIPAEFADKASELSAKNAILGPLIAGIKADDPATLQKAFNAFVELRQAQLKFAPIDKPKDSVVAQLQDQAQIHLQADADITAAVVKIKALLQAFAHLEDQAAQDQGLISELSTQLPLLKQGITDAVGLLDTAEILRRVKLDADLRDLDVSTIATHHAKVGALIAGVGTLADAVDAISKDKAKARAESAGAEILQAFKDVADPGKAGALAGAIQLYTDNHNMHALNVLENTAPGDELREIMFKAMEKGLPFEASMVRNLDLLKQKFIELVEARK